MMEAGRRVLPFALTASQTRVLQVGALAVSADWRL
jgi:hypothetical protein